MLNFCGSYEWLYYLVYVCLCLIINVDQSIFIKYLQLNKVRYIVMYDPYSQRFYMFDLLSYVFNI